MSFSHLPHPYLRIMWVALQNISQSVIHESFLQTWQSIGLHPSQRRTSRVVGSCPQFPHDELRAQSPSTAIMVNHELPLLNWSPCTSGCMLPMELVKAILDEIQNDYLALQACALTCHAWSIIAQQHIFRALDILIHLDCWKPRWLFLTPSIHISPKALSFRKLIEAKPQLGSYVETLTFTIHFDHWFYRSIPELLLDVAYFSSSTFWRRQLPHFVKRLSHVKDICFRGSVQHPLAPMLPRVLIDVFSTILHSSFLTTASISHGSTFGILAECHALENLDIWGVSFYDIDFQQVSFPAHPRILSSLSLRSSVSDYVRFLQSDNIRRIFDLGHLKHLRIQLLGLFVDFAESVVPETENLLRRNKESLEYWICNVCLDGMCYQLHFVIHLTLASRTALRPRRFLPSPRCSFQLIPQFRFYATTYISSTRCLGEMAEQELSEPSAERCDASPIYLGNGQIQTFR